MQYKASLIGFHNPYKHGGLTPKEFLDLYIESLEKKSFKRDGWKRIKLVEWIKEHYEDQLKFVTRLFPRTLKQEIY